MKILFITHKFYPDIGGIEVNSEILANGFAKAGHMVHVATWSQDTNTKHFPFAVIRNPNIVRLMQEHVWADVVFENNPSLRLSWPGLFISRPSVIAIRTWISRMDGTIGIQDQLKRIWLKRARGVIAVSEAVRKRCWLAATVIGNPYRHNEFTILPEMTRNRDFVFLGRLVSDKGADQAVLAIHQILTKHLKGKSLSLTIIGDGPEKAALEKLVADLDLKERVSFTGPLRGKDLVACLNRHKYMLVPSVWEEPFGNVALEGMACGCLPIVSDGGGLPDAVGKAGLIFKRGNLNALVETIMLILQQPELENRLRNAASGHLAAHTPEIITRKYLDVIELNTK